MSLPTQRALLGKQPKQRLQEIAERLHRIFFANTREDAIAALLTFIPDAIGDVGWLLNRERGLRSKLQEALKANKHLEQRLETLERATHSAEREGDRLGIRSPLTRKPSNLEDKADELRQLSKELALDVAMDDAFSDDESDWYETTG